MKKYIKTKIIEAKPMTRGEFSEYRGREIPKNPTDEGYYLEKYPNLHGSWIPKDMFDNNFSEYHEDNLVSTIEPMISKDYKERFKAEYKQLYIRYNGLKNMISKWDKNELNFEPTCPREIYDVQLKAMSDYMSVLEERAKLENINL